MTFAEAGQIMLSGTKKAVIEPITITKNGVYTVPKNIDGYGPLTVSVSSGSDGIWNLFEGREPLIVITVAPNVVYFIYDIGDPYGSYMKKSTYNDTEYISDTGYASALFGVIAYNNKNVYYHNLLTGYGYRAENHYEYVNGALYQTFNREIKTAAVNASKIKVSILSGRATFSGLLKWYQDNLNFQQYDYSDGSHWERRYAWSSSYGGFASDFNISFTLWDGVSYNEQIRGDSITDKYDNWSAVCNSVLSSPSGVFPILNYTKQENHFDKDLYLNDDAASEGFYDNNTAYINKWDTPSLWE